MDAADVKVEMTGASDKEILALELATRAFQAAPPEACRRMIDYLVNRFVRTPVAPAADVGALREKLQREIEALQKQQAADALRREREQRVGPFTGGLT